MARADAADSALLGLGAELLILGLATGVAGISEETGSVMLAFMGGLLILWLMHHIAITNAIPALLSNLQSVGGSKHG